MPLIAKYCFMNDGQTNSIPGKKVLHPNGPYRHGLGKNKTCLFVGNLSFAVFARLQSTPVYKTFTNCVLRSIGMKSRPFKSFMVTSV